jgi:hypothetical protein
VVFAPSKQQQRLLQRAAAALEVEGVTVQDTLQQQREDAAAAAAAAAAEEEEEDDEDEEAAAAAAAEATAAARAAAKQRTADLPPGLASLLSISNQAARREALKQQMALAAQHLLAEPEKHIGPGGCGWCWGCVMLLLVAGCGPAARRVAAKAPTHSHTPAHARTHRLRPPRTQA